MTRSPADFPSALGRLKIQRSSSALPGETTAPAPESVGESASMRGRDAQAPVATGTSAVRNCVWVEAAEGRTRT